MQKLEVGIDVGGLISGTAHGARAIKELTRAMDEAEKKGDISLYGQLGTQRDMLQSNLARFGGDIKTLEKDSRIQEYNTMKFQGKDLSKFSADPEFMSKIGKLGDGQEKLIAALTGVTEAVQKGDLAEIQQSVMGANQGLQDFHNNAIDAVTPTGVKKSMESVMKSVSAMQIAGFVAQGIDRAVGALDRSSIIGQQGAGNVVGSDIEEQRRQASLVGGISEAIGTVVGAALIPILGPLAPAVGMIGGKIPGWIMNANANKDATNDAYSKNWEQQMGGAMELAAVLGNPNNVRGAWKNAADAAAGFGYSAEEGVEAVQQGAAQGLSEQDAIAAAKKVFAFERGTGVDRQTAMEFETRSKRFGMDNALGFAYQASEAAGMAPGQFGEFLRAMQRTFEDGISKGFIKSTQEMVGNYAYMSELTGGNALYQGEAGAKVMQNIGQGFEQAKNLGGVNDILTYRAALKVYDDMGDEEKNQFWGDIKTRDRNTAGRMLLEQGFNPKVFQEAIKLMDAADMKSQFDVTGRMESEYAMSARQANYLYERLKDPNMDADKAYRDALKLAPSSPPSNNSPEMAYDKVIAGFKVSMAEVGTKYFDEKMKTLPDKIDTIINKIGVNKIENAVKDSVLIKDGDLLPDKSITKGFFDEKKEQRVQGSIEGVLFNASRSGDEGERRRADAIVNNFKTLRDSGLAAELNKSDAFNKMGDTRTTEQMLAIMERAVDAIGGLTDEMKKGLVFEGL